MSNAFSSQSSEPAAPVAVRQWPSPLAAGLVAIFLFIAGQIVAALIVGILLYMTGENGADKPVLFGNPVMLQFAYAAVAYGSMLAGLVLYLRRTKLSIGPGNLGLVRPRLGDAGRAVIAFLVYISAYVILITVLSPLVPGLDLDQRQDTGFDGAAGFIPLVLVFLALVVLAPVVEEVLMRGFLFGSLRHRRSFWFATLVTSLVFAAFHLGGGEEGSGLLWIAAIDTFVLSLVLCYLREKTGRLWASIGLHMLKNGVAFTALFIIGD